MKLLRYLPPSSKAPQWGVLTDEARVLRIEGEVFSRRQSDGPLKRKVTGLSESLLEIKLLPPVSPSKIICVGINYREHAREMGILFKNDAPVLFMKPPTTVIGNGDAILLPEMSKKVDYEAELAVIIRREGKDIAPNDFKEYVLGYACANDVTARDLQSRDVQWTRAKGFDTFCPIGPYIETEVDPSNLKIELLLNGEVKQSSHTSDMIYSVPEIVSFVSRVMTLKPGDVILTGTPSGIGQMKNGDQVEVRIEGLGSLVNPVATQRS